MRASVAVAEAMEMGKRRPPPVAGGVDLAVAVTAAAVVVVAVASSFVAVWYEARARKGRLRRIVELGPSVRGARLLLAFFAGLMAASELLRLPYLRRALVPRERNVMPCLTYPLVAHGIAEPGFLAAVLLLLRASTGSVRLPAAALAVPLTCLPFLAAHVALLVAPANVVAYPGELAHAADGAAGRCAYPAYAAALLLVLAAAYVPILASACWAVAAVAINTRVRARALSLAALVVAPVPVQVVALALTSVWRAPRYFTSPTVHLVGFLAAGVSAASALAILVLLPVRDAVDLDKHLPVAADAGGGDRHVADEAIASTFPKLPADRHDLKITAQG